MNLKTLSSFKVQIKYFTFYLMHFIQPCIHKLHKYFQQLLQRFVYNSNQMGTTQSTKHLLQSYNVQSTLNGLKVLSKKQNPSQKYILKTYNTSSLDQHLKKLQYFRSYKSKMSPNMQITKLIDIYEERQQNFCMHTFKIHLLFQYSAMNLSNLIQARKPKKRSKVQKTQIEYFKYEDLCNILYSCLSALWLVQEVCNEGLDLQLKQFHTIFLAPQNILIFEDGTIKIMDPYLIGYEKRYVFYQNINYSPQKLQDFYKIDDEKSAVFELGMTLLEVALLQSMKSAYSGSQLNHEVINKKIYRARQLYSADLQKNLGVNLFDIIEKMTKKNREDRLNLEQAIHYAQQMYQKEDESPPTDQINETIKKCVTSSDKKKELRLTNHSSSAKRTSSSLQKFYQYRDSMIQDKQISDNRAHWQNSPKISNFTIQQVPLQKQESSMLQSFKVQNPTKTDLFTQSLTNGGIFSTLKLNDSYAQNIFDFKPKQQQIFTDPHLLQTIHRELQEIEMRKLRRSNFLQQSQTLQRRDRYQIESQFKAISNKVYLD